MLSAVCSHMDAVVSLMAINGAPELLVRFKTSAAPDTQHFYIALYTDALQSQPVQLIQVRGWRFTY